MSADTGNWRNETDPRRTSRRARAIGGAPAANRRSSRSATARTRARNSRRSNTRPRRPARWRSAPASAPASSRPATAPTRNWRRRNARPSSRILLRGNPRAHAGAGGGGFEEARHRQAGGRGPDLRRRQGVRDAAAAGARGRRHSGAPARHQGRAQRPQGRRAGAGDRGLSARRGADLDRSGQGAGRQEGRLLCRGDRQARPPGHRGDRRHRAGGGEGVSLAEGDALGRGVGQARRAELGAAAAFDRRDVRPGDRGARRRARSTSAASRRATPPTATASCRPRRSR